MMRISAGWLQGVRQVPTPFFNQRPKPLDISLIVIHCISLPPFKFGGPFVDELFTGTLHGSDHPYFKDLEHVELSTHLFINREGRITQYVSFLDRAYHAGRSSYKGRIECNDYSIGIELEGYDTCPYTDFQYKALQDVIATLKATYKGIGNNIAGHCEVAPTRKTDPGPAFDFSKIR